MALGFGRIANSTVLGQPLNFTVPLRFDADEFVAVECVTVEVLSGDNKIAPSSVHVSLEPSGDASAPRLHVRTSALIDEPIVTLEVGVGCPVRLSRKFIAFIDPPMVMLAQTAPAPERAEPVADAAPPTPRDSVATAPRPAPARRADAPAAARPPAAERRASAVRAPRAVVRAPLERRTAAAPTRRSEARVKAAAAPASAGGARLQLDAAPMLARPARSASAVAAAPAAVASVDAAASALAAQVAAAPAASQPAAAAAPPQDVERLRQFEDRLAQLKAEGDATRGQLATLQARLREVEGDRRSDSLVYLLFGLVALLALALAGVLWWARQRERERAAWWAAAAQAASGGTHEHAPQHASVAPPAAAVAEEDDAAADSVHSSGWRHTVEIPELDTGDVPRRAVSAEELIDLEQQAEFFVTLGQDDAAVDLLLNHIGSAGGISPLPYLKLLEIHRHRADREAYERVREQFNQRFNAYAPAWEDRNAPARSLEDDADVMARLQGAWQTPARAMGVLEPLLFRQGTSEPVFDLAAYREVLFLYEVARDLAEHESRPGTVDFELPLDDAPSVVSYPMHNTVPVTPSAHVTRPLSVDLDLGPPETSASDERSERQEAGEFSFRSGFGGLGEESAAAVKPPRSRPN